MYHKKAKFTETAKKYLEKYIMSNSLASDLGSNAGYLYLWAGFQILGIPPANSEAKKKVSSELLLNIYQISCEYNLE